jgi:L-ribulose-5-phosphate 3-epimerase
MNMIGLMQGRLLPKYQGRYQAHPVDYWQEEFPLAKEAGMDCIEFILDFNDVAENPLVRSGGSDEILRLSDETGISVKTICADYFMDGPLHAEDRTVVGESVEVLRRLLASAKRLAVTDIVIPCVDQSSFGKGDGAVERFVATIRPMLDELEKAQINLSLETDLPPDSFVALLERFDSHRITVNYDIGNSASLGYDALVELDAYGHRITDIHIKDRALDGGSVILGTGAADFGVFFDKLREFNYRGPFIMQAYRDDEGVAIFHRQLAWITPYLTRLHGPLSDVRARANSAIHLPE